MASSSGEGNGAGESSALFSKLGSSLFGATNSPQKVVTNIRGFLSNRLTGVSIPDTGCQLGSDEDDDDDDDGYDEGTPHVSER